MDEYTIYDAIIEATDSELILFFIIMAIVFAIVVVPLYIAMLKDRKSARQNEQEGKRQLIEVLKENSSVIASLKTTLESSGNTVAKALERIHNRLDNKETALQAIVAENAQINTKMTNVLDNQRELVSKVNKILILTSGGNLPPKLPPPVEA